MSMPEFFPRTTMFCPSARLTALSSSESSSIHWTDPIMSPVFRITHEFYDRLVLDFKHQRSNCMMELESHQKADSTFQITGSYLLDLAHRAVKLFESSQPAQKRQLLKLILANCHAEGDKLIFNLKAPFEAMRCAKETGKWLPILDEVRTIIEESHCAPA